MGMPTSMEQAGGAGRRWTEWLRPPVFDGDAEKTRVAYVVHAASVATLAVAVVLTAGLSAGGLGPLPVLALPVSFLPVGALARAWLGRGHVERASLLLVAGSWLYITLALVGLGTIRAPALMFYVVTVNLAGHALGTRGMVAVGSLCSLTVGALILAQNHGWLPPADYTVNIGQWAAATAGLISVGGIGFAAVRVASDALGMADADVARRREIEAELTQRAEELRSALDRVGALGGLLPVCGWCRKICDDDGYWKRLESYLAAHTEAVFDVGTCPDCEAAGRVAARGASGLAGIGRPL